MENKVDDGSHPHEEFFKDYNEQPDNKPTYSKWESGNIHLQFHGWEIVLLKDGTYYLNDTTGG